MGIRISITWASVCFLLYPSKAIIVQELNNYNITDFINSNHIAIIQYNLGFSEFSNKFRSEFEKAAEYGESQIPQWKFGKIDLFEGDFEKYEIESFPTIKLFINK